MTDPSFDTIGQAVDMTGQTIRMTRQVLDTAEHEVETAGRKIETNITQKKSPHDVNMNNLIPNIKFKDIKNKLTKDKLKEMMKGDRKKARKSPYLDYMKKYHRDKL